MANEVNIHAALSCTKFGIPLTVSLNLFQNLADGQTYSAKPTIGFPAAVLSFGTLVSNGYVLIKNLSTTSTVYLGATIWNPGDDDLVLSNIVLKSGGFALFKPGGTIYAMAMLNGTNDPGSAQVQLLATSQ